MSEVWATGVWATSATPTPAPTPSAIGRGGFIGELYDTTELYASVELTSTISFINPDNTIKVKRRSNIVIVKR